jgi:hypothetical protein
MSATAALISHTWRVGERTVTMTVPRPTAGGPVCLAMEWVPDKPSALSPAEMRQYREGRAAGLAAVAAQLGAPVGLLEL